MYCTALNSGKLEMYGIAVTSAGRNGSGEVRNLRRFLQPGESGDALDCNAWGEAGMHLCGVLR